MGYCKGATKSRFKTWFFAELINWVRGLAGRADFQFLFKHSDNDAISGREKAIVRSDELDEIWEAVDKKLGSYGNGLTVKSQMR